jgi:hypothetical protein
VTSLSVPVVVALVNTLLSVQLGYIVSFLLN